VSSALVVFLAPDKLVGRDPGDHAWTDAAGRYRLPDVPLGEVCITVIATAYAPQNARFVVAGPATQDFQLRPGETASYRITISGASPEQWSELKCQLRLATFDSGADRRHWTDSNYRCWELGELWPHVREGDTLVYSDLPAELRIGEIGVSVPHGETEPRWLKVRGGRGMHDIAASVVPDRYERNRPIVVRGTLRDPSGKPLPGRRVAQERDVAITDSEGAFALATTAFASGFSLRLDEDDFVLHSADVGEMGIYCHRVEGLAALELVADRSARVTGTVTDNAGAAVFDAEVELLVGPTTTVRRARTAHDGSFALDRLDARVASSLCLRVTSPGGTHTTGRWQLSPGQHLQVGSVAIPAAATIEGTIVDEKGKPRCGIEVCLIRHGDVLDLWHVYTDRLGNYACGGLPAGDYSVKIDSPHAMHVEWPDYARVTVSPGERVVVTRGMSFPWPLLLAVAAGALAILPVLAWRRRQRPARASSD